MIANSILKQLMIPEYHIRVYHKGVRLNMTEKLFTGTLNHNQNKNKQTTKAVLMKIVETRYLPSVMTVKKVLPEKQIMFVTRK